MYKKATAGLLLVLIAVPAFAAVTPAFWRIDADQNGTISLNEATIACITEEIFTRFDLDKDTRLSMDEYQALTDQHG